MSRNAIEALDELLSRPEGSWNLAEGALAIARLEQPNLDEPRYIAMLDALGRRARRHVGEARHPRFVAAGIARAMFWDGHIACEEALDTSEHCLLDRVLEGAPATPTMLAVIFIEVGRRCGFRFEGVGFPSRFLVRRDVYDRACFFDPLHKCRPISAEECRELLESSSGGRKQFREGFLRPITSAQILARIVADLKSIYWRRADHARALAAIKLLLTIRPDDPREIRDHGRVLLLLERFAEAIASFERYLSHNPRGEDADVVRMLLREARAGHTLG
ncbi:MAG: tetratricopeptide repeat protein [Acidobacteriota bacterium]|nr:MAG: tetratricopeptide repeat protein [Acidobacteriota bacterium]